ncbi:hypothetical protein H0E87_016486, partial [Populus deltoides]
MSSDRPRKFAKRNPQYRDTKQAFLRNTSSFRVSETVGIVSFVQSIRLQRDSRVKRVLELRFKRQIGLFC